MALATPDRQRLKYGGGIYHDMIWEELDDVISAEREDKNLWDDVYEEDDWEDE